jgi:hypothetical protein
LSWQKIIKKGLFGRTKMHKHKLEEDRDKKEHSLYTPTSFGVGLVTVVCFMLLFGIGVASATDYYVAVGGNNADTGLSPDHAWATPSHAANRVVVGDTIYLMDGTWYNEHVVFANSGTEGKPITMKAYPGATPVFDGVTGTETAISISRDYIIIDGITFRDYRRGAGIHGASHSHILNCKAYPNYALAGEAGGFALGRDAHYCSIEGCTVVGDAWNSIQISGRYYWNGKWYGKPSDHLTVKNCTVYDNTLHNLIDLFGDLSDITIENNKLGHEDYESSGLFMHQGVVKNLKVINNRFVNCFRAADQAMFLNNVKNSYIAENHIENVRRVTAAVKVWHSDYGVDDKPEDITFYNNEIHGCDNLGIYVYGGASDITCDHNLIHDTGSSNYRFTSNGEIINQRGKKFTVRSSGGAIEIKFTDGRTFSVDDEGEYPSYTITSGTHTIDIHGVSSVGTISGTVTDAGAGLDIEGATVSVEGTGKSGETDTNGVYAIAMPTGTYTVTVSKTGFESLSKPVTVTAGQTTIVNFAFAAVGMISGTVKDTSDNPIKDATVTDGTRSDITNTTGQYTLSNVPIGNYTVTTSKAGFESLSKPATVTAGQTTTVNFALNLVGDIFPPTTNAAITPPPNEADWNNVTPAVVTFFAMILVALALAILIYRHRKK